MKKKFLLGIAIAAMGVTSLVGCSGKWVEPDMSRTYEKLESSLYVNKVENISDDFIMGMDASSVIAEEASGVVYRDFNGQEKDVFEILSYAGINYIRVRIWNDPYDENGKGYGGGNNDIQKAVEIGKRATKYKMRLLVDFHYSDFWADPAKQMSPKAWEKMDISEKQEALYKFTKDSLLTLQKNKIAVGMVQIGNETNAGKMAGETRFSYYCALFNEGSRAVREVYPNALVACHFANPEKGANMIDWANKMEQYEVDYDVFGSSYYPYWHGTLDNLAEVLSTIAEQHNKKTMVMETSYAYTVEDSDFWGNTIGEGGAVVKDYPFTIAGQTNSVRNIIDTVVNKTKNGIGVCYWEGTWITVGMDSYDANKLIWEKYGSGWASSYSKDYDPEDAGRYYGGCAVENQAFFDKDGKALESLKVWNLVRFGNQTTEYIDGVLDARMSKYNYEEFTLPATVDVIYNSNRREAVAVTWEWTQEDVEAAKLKGNADYDIKGVVGGREAHCYLSIMEKNFLENYSFEDGLDPWVINNLSDVELSGSYKVLVPNDGDVNPKNGDLALHFWSQASQVLKFEVEQTVTLVAGGAYKFQFSILGGAGTGSADPDAQNVYGYAKVGDQLLKQEVKFTSYNDGYVTGVLTGINVAANETITVGLHVESSEADVWGDIDDFMLNLVL